MRVFREHMAERRCCTSGLIGSLLVLLIGLACEGGTENRALASWPVADTIPTLFEGHRIYARPILERGDTLTLFTDTGGGLFLHLDVVERLGLAIDSSNQVSLPRFRMGQGIPAPHGSSDGRIFVLDSRESGMGDFDGMLGQQWFADRVWLFDYPRGHLLLLRDSGAMPEIDPRHRVPLGFKTDSTGERLLSFPRIRVEIDGDSIDLLFDTGATVRLTPEAMAELGVNGSEHATCFITSSALGHWRARHPDWRTIENADLNVPGMTMIEVPEISVAGHTAGPVWFTERPDENFHEYMSQFMDQRVDGAVGGSALQYFTVIVDYLRATATFTRDRN